jgi:group II intron reverse transcriptase/maturase
MIQACDALDILRAKNQANPKWINRGLYRLLYNPTLHILAYERLKSKPGNMTPGTDGATLDGFGMKDIERYIALLKTEHYQPNPVRRRYIPKADGKRQRPLGVPSPHDKIIQECLRLILEAIYEPNFHDNSHGFRPGRSCHTALESLRRNWAGTKWVIELDITECFERIDHNRLLDILRERIQDDRLINLIRRFLNAGYLENWVHHKTYSGTPQGSVVSPILTNIYLDRLDRKLEDICRRHSQGERRKTNPTYAKLMRQRRQLLKRGEADVTRREEIGQELQILNRRLMQTGPYDYHDASYTRVRFLRYADDGVIGVIGPKSLAEQILEEIASFLTEDLKLELNREKTRITHLATEKARFLGYEFKISGPRWRRSNLQRHHSPHNVTQTIRTTSGNVTLLVPLRDLTPKLKRYMADGQPASFPGLVNQPIDHIIDHYNALIRGWYNYYQLALNVSSLHYARYVLLYSLAKTLAWKERSSVSKVFKKYGKSITFRKPNGRTVQFFNQPMRQVKKAQETNAEVDTVLAWRPRTTRTRLLDHCALCDSAERVEMHHVRHIRKHGERVQGFTLYMAAINRKQVPVCQKCHQDIHRGKYDGANLADILDQIETAPQPERRGTST